MTRPHSEQHDDDDDITRDAPTAPAPSEDADGAEAPNPPRTTTWGWFTAPKFGSAGSGGAELEPGPERD